MDTRRARQSQVSIGVDQFRQRHEFNIPGQRMAFFSGIHRAQLVKFQIGNSVRRS
jgi:hypothetical protein